MEKSYDEILKILDLMDRSELSSKVYKGSRTYLKDESVPVESDAARFMAALADEYTPDNPLYIVAIGCITNVASAILMNPKMTENCVVVWLGGNVHTRDAWEFNMAQDIASARVIFNSGVPLVQLPCMGCVDAFHTTRYDIEHWLLGKNKLCDYLATYIIEDTESFRPGKPWSRIIWDVTAVAWLLNDNNRFMESVIVHAPIPEYDGKYAFDNRRHLMRCASLINVDDLMDDLFSTLAK